MNDKRISRKELARQNLKRNKKRKNIRTIIIIAITAVMVYITGLYGASLAYVGDFISSGMTLVEIGKGFPVQDDFSQVLQAEKMGTGLCILTPGKFEVYSPTAKKIFDYSHTMQNPVMETAKHRSVIYDSNGTSLKIANGHTVLFQKEMPNNIIHADISNSNRVAITTRSDSYNGEVSVFNFNMEQRFVWYCAKGYPIYSKLSENGNMMAVSAIQSDSGLLKSYIYVINAAKGNEIFCIEGSEYPLKLEFLSDKKLLAVYPGKLAIYNTSDGSEIAKYDFDRGILQTIHKDNTYITLCYGGMNDNENSNLVLLDHNLDKKFEVSVPEGVKDLSVSQSRIFVLGNHSMYEYDFSGNLQNTFDTGPLYKHLVDFNGTTFISSTEISKVEKTKRR